MRKAALALAFLVFFSAAAAEKKTNPRAFKMPKKAQPAPAAEAPAPAPAPAPPAAEAAAAPQEPAHDDGLARRSRETEEPAPPAGESRTPDAGRPKTEAPAPQAQTAPPTVFRMPNQPQPAPPAATPQTPNAQSPAPQAPPRLPATFSPKPKPPKRKAVPAFRLPVSRNDSN
jgi:hypothetical protein